MHAAYEINQGSATMMMQLRGTYSRFSLPQKIQNLNKNNKKADADPIRNVYTLLFNSLANRNNTSFIAFNGYDTLEFDN